MKTETVLVVDWRFPYQSREREELKKQNKTRVTKMDRKAKKRGNMKRKSKIQSATIWRALADTPSKTPDPAVKAKLEFRPDNC